MTPGLSQHAPDMDTLGPQRQSREPGSAAVGPGTPGKMPSKRCSCPGTRRPASSDSQRSNAPSLGSGGGPSPPVKQWVRRSCGGLSAESARAASGEFGQGGCGDAVSSAAGYTPAGRGRRAGSPVSRGVERERREGKRRAPGLTPPRSGEHHRLGEGVRLAGPSGRVRLRDPRPPRPRSAPPPSPVPRQPAVPRFSRRTGTGQARDSGSRAGGRRGAGPGRAGACSPAGPPRAARPPAKPGPAPAPGLSRNNLLEAVTRAPSPLQAFQASGSCKPLVRTPLPCQGSSPGHLFPQEFQRR